VVHLPLLSQAPSDGDATLCGMKLVPLACSLVGLVVIGALGAPTTACSSGCFDLDLTPEITSCAVDSDCFGAETRVCNDCTGICQNDVGVNATGYAQYQANLGSVTGCHIMCPATGGGERCIANQCVYSATYGHNGSSDAASDASADGGAAMDGGGGDAAGDASRP